MSGKVSGWVWDLELPQNEKYILLAYADHADHDGHNIFPSIDLVARKTGYSKRTIQRATRSLQEKGYLIPMGGQSGGRGISAKWSIPIKGDILSSSVKGDNGDAKRVTPKTQKGDIAIAPEPSLNVTKEEPSVKPKKVSKTKYLTKEEVLFIVKIPVPLAHKQEFIDMWQEFVCHRSDINKPFTERGAEMMLTKLEKCGVDNAISALEEAISNGWQGVFPHDNNGGVSRANTTAARNDAALDAAMQEVFGDN